MVQVSLKIGKREGRMYRTDLWCWVDNKSPAVTPKTFAYSLETVSGGKTVRRSKEGSIDTSWHQAELEMIAEALERFTVNAEVVIHSSNKWVLDRIENNLADWEENGFKTKKGEGIKNADLWKRIAKKRRMLVVRTKYVGMEESTELMRHTISWGREEQ